MAPKGSWVLFIQESCQCQVQIAIKNFSQNQRIVAITFMISPYETILYISYLCKIQHFRLQWVWFHEILIEIWSWGGFMGQQSRRTIEAKLNICSKVAAINISPKMCSQPGAVPFRECQATPVPLLRCSSHSRGFTCCLCFLKKLNDVKLVLTTAAV